MTRTRRTLQKLARLESMPAEIPRSLEAAFEAVENLDAMHPTSRGQMYGAIIQPPDRANAPRMTQDER